MKNTDILLRSIHEEVLLGKTTFKDIKTENVLAGRDAPQFEQRWLKLFDDTQTIPLTKSDAVVIDQIREIAFKTVFRNCSNADLASYISDDFEVIARGIIGKMEDVFLVKLLETYSAGRIPHGDILSPGISLRLLLKKIEDQLR